MAILLAAEWQVHAVVAFADRGVGLLRANFLDEVAHVLAQHLDSMLALGLDVESDVGHRRPRAFVGRAFEI
jgi:hypothetical protein